MLSPNSIFSMKPIIAEEGDADSGVGWMVTREWEDCGDLSILGRGERKQKENRDGFHYCWSYHVLSMSMSILCSSTAVLVG